MGLELVRAVMTGAGGYGRGIAHRARNREVSPLRTPDTLTPPVVLTLLRDACVKVSFHQVLGAIHDSLNSTETKPKPVKVHREIITLLYQPWL